VTSCERSCLCFVFFCFHFEINPAVVMLPYVVLCNNLTDVDRINLDTVQ
jgi:hypothetical protein